MSGWRSGWRLPAPRHSPCDRHFRLSPALIRDKVGGAQERIERACVGPPAVEIRECHGALTDVAVVDVGNLEFTALGRNQRVDLLENASVVHVNTSDGEVRFRLPGLLLNANDAIATQFGNAEALGVRDFLEEDARALL